MIESSKNLNSYQQTPPVGPKIDNRKRILEELLGRNRKRDTDTAVLTKQKEIDRLKAVAVLNNIKNLVSSGREV